jgi:isopenicillin-N N-acyltransferase like protein
MAIAFPHIQAAGSYRELGRAVGEGAHSQIAQALAFYEEHFAAMAGISFAEAVVQARRYLPFVERHLPQYVDELEGMAEGSGQPFEKLLVPNCAEEFTCRADHDGGPQGDKPGGHFCTAVAVHTGGRHLLGHNMDWYVVDADKNVLFDLTTPQGTRIVTIAGVPYLPILGMNSHGLAYVGNSLYSTDDRLGVPNAFVRRWVLESSSLEQAVQRATTPVRARGSNHLLGDRAGRVWNVETSGADAVVTEHDEVAAHTNHYIEPAMQTYEGYRDKESPRRLAAARRRLVAGLQVGEDPLQLVRAVLRNHACSPDSICGHADTFAPPAEQVMTVASMICDLDEMRLYACAGPPCSNEYRSFTVVAP